MRDLFLGTEAQVRAKRKTQIDKAIETIDSDIVIVEQQLAVLRAARLRLVAQQNGNVESTAAAPAHEHGHPEGGRGI